MMDSKNIFSFDNLATNGANNEIKEGQHKLTIKEAKKVIASTGTQMLQCTYSIDNSNKEVRFDNCPLVTGDGKAINFGQTKLKNIMVATKTTPKTFTLDTLSTLLKGKSFLANISKNEQGYWVLTDIGSIIAVDFANEPEPKAAVEEEIIVDETSTLGEKEIDITDIDDIY